jgi:hypothetical protein
MELAAATAMSLANAILRHQEKNVFAIGVVQGGFAPKQIIRLIS